MTIFFGCRDDKIDYYHFEDEPRMEDEIREMEL